MANLIPVRHGGIVGGGPGLTGGGGTRVVVRQLLHGGRGVDPGFTGGGGDQCVGGGGMVEAKEV